MTARISIVAMILGATVFFSLANSQSSWTWENPQPTGSDLRAAILFSSDSAIIVGQGGTILTTADLGASWSFQQTGTLMSLSDITFIDGSIGIAVGGDYGVGYVILRTSNGGQNWITYEIDTDYRALYAVSFNESGDGIAVGGGLILTSSDAGVTWTTQLDLLGKTLYDVSFQGDVGIAVSPDGSIVRTSDRGETWGVRWDGGSAYWLYSVARAPSGDWFVVGSYIPSSEWLPVMLRSSNAGISWEVVVPPSGSLGLYQVDFFSDIGVVTSFSGEVFLSTDSGFNWYGIPSVQSFGKAYFVTPEQGFFVGPHGLISTTANAGLTWTPYKNSISSQAMKAVHYPSDDIGIVVGEGGIFRKTGVGQPWSEQGNFSYLNDVHFDKSGSGFAVGDDGKILRTTNTGGTWIQQAGTSTDLASVHVIDQDTVIAVGYENVLRTTDGGITWNTNYFVPGKTVHGVSMETRLRGIAVGSSSLILITSDGGRTWKEQQQTGCLAYGFWQFNDVAFVDSSTALVVGSNGQEGVVFRTTDFGLNWSCQTVAEPLFGISGVSESGLALVIGRYGEILQTIDRGATWETQSPPTSSYLLDAFFHADGNVTLVGWDGTIVRRSQDGATGVHTQQEGLPILFSLYQNYPNPFNAISNFEFAILNSSQVSLKIYDLLGREIATIVNEKLGPGTYTRQWNAAGMASGVYLYRLTAGNFAQTRKLVLIR